MDNSDGLLPTLNELAKKNKLKVNLDITSLRVPDLRPDEEPDSARMWLGWGDWNVVVSVGHDSLDKLLARSQEIGAVAIPIGRMLAGSAGVVITNGDHTINAPDWNRDNCGRLVDV